jgi:hypothetical protein
VIGRAPSWLVVAALLVAPGVAAADELPSLYAPHTLAGVRNSTASVLIGDLRQSGGAHVLPPTTGRSIVAGFEPGGNLEHCQSMADLQRSSRELVQQMAVLVLDTEPLNVELERLRDAKVQLREAVARHKVYRVLDQQVRRMGLDIEDLEDDIAALEGGCVPTCSDDVRADIAELECELAALRKEIVAVAADAAEQRALHQEAEGQLAEVEAQEAALSADLARRMAELVAARQQTLDMYEVYARLEGGSAVLEYRSGWDDDIATLRAENPGVWFRPIATRDARVVAGLAGGIGEDSYLASSPSITSYTVNGVAVAAGSAPAVFAEYPREVRLDATLTLTAACVQHAPELFDVEKSQAGLPLFGMTVTYAYPTVFMADVTVELDLWRLYLRLREAGGGLWVPRPAVVLTGSEDDPVRFDWSAPGPAPDGSPVLTELDPAVRREAEQRITYELIQELMARIGEVRDGGDPFARYDVPAAPRSGVVPPAPQRAPLALRPVGSSRCYDEILGTTTTRPRLEGPRRTARPVITPRTRVTIALPGASGVDSTDIVFEAPPSPRILRILTTAIQQAKGRRSYECGWYGIWCDGQTWVERVPPKIIRALLGRWESRRYGQQHVTHRIGSTVYAP